MPIRGETTAAPNPMRTGPGQMLMVNSLMKESNEKLAVLEGRLRQFEGALPVQLLDPGQVVRSRWANRADASFESAAFEQLKDEIAQAHGNIQPIKVRPLAHDSGRYEIIFGHRRHRACADLRLPVLALVESVSDAELFKQMDRENRLRADLSPWEQGAMYRKALSEGLFSSREHLAREIGIDPGNLSKALRLADLDPVVLAAFESPLELQYRWAKPLADAFARDRNRVLEIIKDLGATSVRLSAKQVFERLTAAAQSPVLVDAVQMSSKVGFEILFEGTKVVLQFERRLLDDARLEQLRSFISTQLLV